MCVPSLNQQDQRHLSTKLIRTLVLTNLLCVRSPWAK